MANPLRGWVYVLSNQAMPGLLKVGYSMNDPVIRAKQLAGTGIPQKFVLEFDLLVHQPKELEKKLHKALLQYSAGREFFRIQLQEAVKIINAVLIKSEIKPLACYSHLPLSELLNGQNLGDPISARVRQPAEPIAPQRANPCGICGQNTWPTDSRCGYCFALL